MTPDTELRWFKEVGERPCSECDSPHVCYWIGQQPGLFQSWADPIDGHAYKPISWEQMYRREVERHAVEATGGTESS